MKYTSPVLCSLQGRALRQEILLVLQAPSTGGELLKPKHKPGGQTGVQVPKPTSELTSEHAASQGTSPSGTIGKVRK